MFAGTVRDAEARRRLPAECSAISVRPTRSGGGTLAAQNWDWLSHAAETIVILEVSRPDGLNYVTVVEAGLLAKLGMTSSGIAVTTNALVSDADQGRPGVPYHVLLRALFDAETLDDGLESLRRPVRSSSANFILTDRDGRTVDVEAAPGDRAHAFSIEPIGGVLMHTNHFISERFDGRDISTVAMPGSPARLRRMQEVVARSDSAELDAEGICAILGDHTNGPFGVCSHPDEEVPEPERSLTLASVVMDPGAGTILLAPGNPCETPFELLDYAAFLAESTATPSVTGPGRVSA